LENKGQTLDFGPIYLIIPTRPQNEDKVSMKNMRNKLDKNQIGYLFCVKTGQSFSAGFLFSPCNANPDDEQTIRAHTWSKRRWC